MTPKEKAKELVDKYLDITPVDYSLFDTAEQASKKATLDFQLAKNCALIAVDELINCSISYDNYNATWASQVKYWQEVKQEIEKL